MKNKLRSILLIMLLIFASIQIINLNESNTLADPGDGGGNGDNYLDFGYMWNTTSYLANIIHTAYNSTDIKKGRYFGSYGDLLTSDMLYRNFTTE